MGETSDLCPNCGARSRTTRYCEYCGTRLAGEGGAEVRGGRAAGAGGPTEADLRTRFRALVEHPDTARHLAEPTSQPAPGRGSPFPLLAAGLVAVAVAVVVALRRGSLDGPAPLVAGFVVLVAGSLALRRRGRAAACALPARVVTERTSVEKSRGVDSVTSHFVTLEFEDGHRREYRVAGRLAGLIERDDMGVARLAGSRLLEFTRVAV